MDISRVGDKRRDPLRVAALLRALGRHCATEADYLQALERLMVIEPQPPWSPHLRSRARLRKRPKRHFVDPSLALAALGAGPERLLADLEWFGLLFESLVIRDLRVFSQPLAGEVFPYRDDHGLEVDAILQLRDGRWAAIEIKLGEGHVDRAASVSGGDLRQGLRLPPAGWHRGGAGGGAGALSQAGAGWRDLRG